MSIISSRSFRSVGAALLIGALSALSEARAQGQPSTMGNMPGMGGMSSSDAAKPQTASGTGTVTAINAAQRKVTVNHEPIPAINWPAMTMEFPAAASVDLAKVKPGSKVRFTLSGSGSSYTVESITPAQ